MRANRALGPDWHDRISVALAVARRGTTSFSVPILSPADRECPKRLHWRVRSVIRRRLGREAARSWTISTSQDRRALIVKKRPEK